MGAIVRSQDRTSEESGAGADAGAGAGDSALGSKVGAHEARAEELGRSLGQCHNDTLVADSCRESPTNPPSLLQERGRDSLGSLPILTSLDSRWKQGTARASDNCIFREQLEVQ